MEKNKISIIVPVYNGEKTIKRAIDSILNQSFQNIEIIIVNDGSTDNTAKILKNNYEGNNKIKIFNNKNEGVSYARNFGISKASGQYIGFVDIDDFIDENMYLRLIHEIKINNADVIFCSYKKIRQDRCEFIGFPWNCNKEFYGEDIFKEFFPHMIAKLKNEKTMISGVVWRMLIKSEIAKNCYFNEEVKIGEDVLYIYDVLEKCKKIFILNEALYNYVVTDNSTVRKYKSDLEEINQKYHRALLEKIERNSNWDSYFIRYQLNRFAMYTTMISNICKNCSSKKYKKKLEIKDLIIEFLKDKYINNKILKELSISNKFVFFCMKFNLSSIIFTIFTIKIR